MWFVIVALALALLLSPSCVDGGASLVSSFIQSTGFATERNQAPLALLPGDESVEQFLTTASDRLTIQRRNGDSIQLYVDNGEVIVRRVDRKVQPKGVSTEQSASSHGIFGFYKLPEGHFVALIAASSSVDVPLPGIRKVEGISLVKIPSSRREAVMGKDSTAPTRQADAVRLLMKAFKRHQFYFSRGEYDISRTFQENSIERERNMRETSESEGESESESGSKGEGSPWRLSDERFFWNLNTVAPLIKADCGSFVTPVVNAWIASERVSFRGTDYTFTLLSRRGRRRQGPRYIKRGSDELGDVANFAETEQIVQHVGGEASSFVQIRGSIPMFWSQPSAFKLKPVVIPSTTDIKWQARAIKTHLLDLVNSYILPFAERNDEKGGVSGVGGSGESMSSIQIINLVDKKGIQGELGVFLYNAFNYLHSPNGAGVRVFPKFGDTRSDATSSSSTSSSSGSTSTSPPDVSLLNLTAAAELGAIFAAAEGGLIDRDKTTSVAAVMHVSLEDIAKLFDDQGSVSSSGSGSGTGTGMGMGSTDSTEDTDADTDTLPVVANLIWFDYHHKCKEDASKALEIFPLIQCAISTRDGFYLSGGVSGGGGGRSVQKHLVRTNCMDCLDRTNVMQTTISRWLLMRQLRTLDLIITNASSGAREAAYASIDQESALLLDHPEIEKKFRRMWTENGDYLSMMYAGSRAMKRDVTKNGVRTQKGAFDDAVSFATRYYLNNYKDESKQAGIDLMLGQTQGGQGLF
ncbi:SacI homology domain-containing protein [Ochromonadaceae sp. CCMP2298]|nr:SacI homology domain-containing protein [Ochromonadaceae sp. CCMP2298]